MKKTANNTKTEPVKIKSRFGMEPGKWLFWMYVIILALLLFFIGFLPGILNGKMYVTFTDSYGNAAVYVDGFYKGGTPFSTTLESGEHEIEYRVFGTTTDSFTIKVKHPVFLTWCFPRKTEVTSTAELTAELKQRIELSFLSKVEKQSAIVKFDSVHNYEPVFAELKAASATPSDDIINSAIAYISSPEMLNDARTSFPGYDYSVPEALFEGKDNGIAALYKTKQQGIRGGLIGLNETSLKAGEFTLNGYEISASGIFPMGEESEFEYQDSIDAKKAGVIDKTYSLSRTLVTEAMFNAFTAENPYWSADNKETLIAEGLADSYYLSGVGSNAAKSVRNISYSAAEAFCTWLSEKSGRTVFIPSEEQWEAVPQDLTDGGSFWEFTSTKYVPLKRIYDVLGMDIPLLAQDGDIILKGGSYLEGASKTAVGICDTFSCSSLNALRVAWY